MRKQSQGTVSAKAVTVQRMVGALYGKRVWLSGETKPRYIHSITYSLTAKPCKAQPNGIVIAAVSEDMVSYKRPNDKASNDAPNS